MAEKLGIFVSSDDHLDHLTGLTQAAKEAGKEVIIFLTNFGVNFTQDERLNQVIEQADGFTFCAVNYQGFGLENPVEKIVDTAYATQARHGMMIEDCDRYVVL